MRIVTLVPLAKMGHIFIRISVLQIVRLDISVVVQQLYMKMVLPHCSQYVLNATLSAESVTTHRVNVRNAHKVISSG